MVDIIKQNPLGTRIFIFAPIVNNEKGTHKETLQKFQTKGFERVRIDRDEVVRFSELKPLDKNSRHSIDIVVDRLVLKEDSDSRLYESLETALDVGDGYVIVKMGEKEELFSDKQSCKHCGFSVPPLEPRLFSFNAPLGACPECNGLGIKRECNPALLIQNENLSINQGAIVYYKNIVGSLNIEWQEFEYICNYYSIPMDIPYRKLTKAQQDIIMYGSPEPIKFQIKSASGNVNNKTGFEGVKNHVDRMYMTTSSEFMRGYYANFMEDTTCTKCKGARLDDKVLSVRVDGLNIFELCNLSLKNLLTFIKELPSKLNEEQNSIGNLVIKEIRNRVSFLVDVGLDYLSLARMAMTLSGGEAQRIRLAIVNLTKGGFLRRVANYEANPTEWKFLGDKPALIDFYASWCGKA